MTPLEAVVTVVRVFGEDEATKAVWNLLGGRSLMREPCWSGANACSASA
jgi:hypothetical protein